DVPFAFFTFPSFSRDYCDHRDLHAFPTRRSSDLGPVQTGSLNPLDLVVKLVEAGADINARMHAEPNDGNRNDMNRIGATAFLLRSEEHTSELQSRENLVCRLLLEKKKRR